MPSSESHSPRRMEGLLGFDDVLPFLRENAGADGTLPDWFAFRSHDFDPENPNSVNFLPPDQENHPVMGAWIHDGSPKLRGSAYADFFCELDGWTEYWDIYQPQTQGKYYFGDGTHPGYLAEFLPSPTRFRNPVFDRWKALALSSGVPADGELQERFRIEATRPQVADAVLAVDELVRRLVQKHFSRDGGPIDEFAYLDAMERFGRDVLPVNPERYNLIPADDPRKPTALHHTIEGDIMWFGWAVHLECAELVAPADEQAQAVRRLLMAGTVLGCSFDFAFRGRRRTRREYVSADASAWTQIWKRAHECVLDFHRGASEMQDLFRIREYGD